ncbi:cuticle protein 21.3 isoform X2 [Toxorhynchites rutilus septentrionalis]|uniref:cuticle protein 21.3 isoform X2 n=1 Tax=Toxorhynchites rutilus septentrionalis TaxID=329112 RepID=UPI00247B187F|nr:cuticle protein 21.3 isoform X2 [Toxorhynchites rutilus septentrionalis]
MAFKYVILAALVACVSAGGPAAYSIAAPSLGYGSVGASHEHTVKGLYGQNVLSQYSKAVDSAHSSVRVHSSRLSNDGIAYAPHYAAAAYPAAPAVHYGGAAVVKAAYPAYGHAYGAPAYGHAYGAAAYGHAFAAAPVVKAAAYPAYGHGYAAPLAAAPLAHPGAVVQFAGLGAHYAW